MQFHHKLLGLYKKSIEVNIYYDHDVNDIKNQLQTNLKKNTLYSWN